ncbi:Serine/threonine-protein kinase MRCK alpha [Nymphon striatum]|nr:Serine/threonine-protein kinase MRCK alpha [Nymphon striatum]
MPYNHADDTVLIADSAAQLQELINAVNESGKQYSMTMNVEKTKSMVISKVLPVPIINIMLETEAIKQTSSMVYLGHMVTEDGKNETEIKRRIGIAKDAFNNMENILTSRNLKIGTKKRLVKCYIWSTLLYGAETWTLIKIMMTKIEAFEMWIHRRMLKISYTEHRTNEFILRKIEAKRSLMNTIKKRKCTYFGHIMRKEDGLQRLLLEGKIHGRRGRPRTAWYHNIKEWTGMRYADSKPIINKVKSLRLKKEDFEILKVIGRGAFGEVAVVKMKQTDKVYAMKILNKWEMLKSAETACFQEERNVMVFGDRRWITDLHYSFQDQHNLYLVMNYYCGGDLLTLLSKFEDRLPEDMAKFYITEMILAIDSIHNLGYVHRDIKPDNVLLDANGHIRLADFGSCLKMCEDGTVQSNVAVGTPDYISPEILRAMEDGHGKYGPECDWWSLGVCMFEMLFGITPFYAESLVDTYGKIMNHKNCFDFPPDLGYDVSDEAKDLMSKLICSAEYRISQNGLDDFKNHPWFEGIDWENIRDSKAPYIPEVSSPTDTSNFDVDDNNLKMNGSTPPTANSAFTGLHLPFIGFTFTQKSKISDLSCLDTEGSSTNVALDPVSKEAYECRIGKLEKEKIELSRKLQDALKSAQSNFHPKTTDSIDSGKMQGTDGEVRKLKDEVNVLTRKNSELRNELFRIEQDNSEMITVKHQFEAYETEKSTQFIEMEKTVKTYEIQNDKLHRVNAHIFMFYYLSSVCFHLHIVWVISFHVFNLQDLDEFEEKLKIQSKELQHALDQRKLAMSEYSEVSDKLADLRSQKQKLSRQVRDKEEELETAMQKIDNLRQDIRKADKLKREVENQLEDVRTDFIKEKKMKERLESNNRKLDTELTLLKQKQRPGLSGSSLQHEVCMLYNELKCIKALLQCYLYDVLQMKTSPQELSKLKADMERMDVQYKEKLGQQQSRLGSEIKHLRDLFQDAERDRDKYHEELSSAKEKLERTRSESISENQEIFSEMKRIQEREKLLLTEDNKKLHAEIERVRGANNKAITEKRHLEDELAKLSEKKETVAQWEAQIDEIIKWVSDEKDARGYLQALATKMTEELENLKISPVPSTPTTDKNWKNRRSQKLDKMELLSLQSSLQNEMHAKQAISNELTKVRSELLAAQQEVNESRQQSEKLKKEMNRKDHQIRDLQHKTDSTDGFLERPSSQMSFLDQFLKDTSLRRSGDSVDDSDLAGEDADIEDNPSINSSKSSLSALSAENTYLVSPTTDSMPTLGSSRLKVKAHHFLIRTFVGPLKCHLCTSLMIGLVRQGAVCEVCGFACHVACQDKVPGICPVPENQSKRPSGIDPTRGVGTAYEGYVKVPRPGGVKRGWMRQFVVVCDFKLFFYDLYPDKNAEPDVSASQVLDMRDEEFSVSSVSEFDVIHANRKDIPCIFRVTTSMMNPPGMKNHTLLLVDRESEKSKWVDALNELHRILRRSKLPHRAIFQAKGILDNTLTIIKNALSAIIIDPDRIVLGTEEGLYCIDLDKDEFAKIGEGKKIYEMKHIGEEQILIVIAGKQRYIRLIPIGALDSHEVEWIKVSETKGCSTFCIGQLHRSPSKSYCFCVAVKRQIIIFEINRTKTRHQKIREIMLPGIAQCMDVMGDKICIGFESAFYLYSINGEFQPLALVPSDNKSLMFLTHNPLDALAAVELPNYEYLLVFSTMSSQKRKVPENGDVSRKTARCSAQQVAAILESDDEETLGFDEDYPSDELKTDSDDNVENDNDSESDSDNENPVDRLPVRPVFGHNLDSGWNKKYVGVNKHLGTITALGIYVDSEGRKSRDKEIMFPDSPVAVSVAGLALCIYSEAHVDIFEVTSGDWIQTICLRKCTPLCRNGSLNLCFVNELPHIVYMRNLLDRTDAVHVPEVQFQSQASRSSKTVIARTRRRFSVREYDKSSKVNDRRSRLISGPSNFSHVKHMGPGDGIIHMQKLMDLPALDSSSAQDPNKIQQLRNIFGQSGVSLLRRNMNTNNRPLSSIASISPDGSISSQEHSSSNPNVLNVGASTLAPNQNDDEASPRHSVTSNNSSNLSSPPSPGINTRLNNMDLDKGSSSYDS